MIFHKRFQTSTIDIQRGLIRKKIGRTRKRSRLWVIRRVTQGGQPAGSSGFRPLASDADEIYRMGDIASSIGEENALALLGRKIELSPDRRFRTNTGSSCPSHRGNHDLLASDASRLRFEIRVDGPATTEMICDRETDCREEPSQKASCSAAHQGTQAVEG